MLCGEARMTRNGNFQLTRNVGTEALSPTACEELNPASITRGHVERDPAPVEP